jgi:dissimilatory sulfite reductase (desulfoviridin) alpha/beta subunit
MKNGTKHLLSRGGVIPSQDPDRCIVRLRIPAGEITPDQMSGIARIARKHGVPVVHMTTRQTMELPQVDPKAIEPLVKSLERNGTPLGAEKQEVVNITACPGTDRCRFANIETRELAAEIDRRFFGRDLPVKVRIAISACPNGCMSERLNEIGITGTIRPVREEGLCTGCGTCAHHCKEEAIRISGGKVVLDQERCMLCGMCVSPCPFEIIKADPPEYQITVGGRRGRHPLVGRHLVTVTSPGAVVDVIEMIITWIYRNAYSDRQLPDQLDELDFDIFKEEVRKACSTSRTMSELEHRGVWA